MNMAVRIAGYTLRA